MDEVPPVQPERERAIDLAYRAVGSRDRTVAELRTYLERKRVEPAAVDDAVAELIEAGFLDDARYARRFAEDKRELERWGTERIARDLRRRGVGPEQVEAAVAAQDRDTEPRPRSCCSPRASPSRPRTTASATAPGASSYAAATSPSSPTRRSASTGGGARTAAPPRGLRLSRGLRLIRGGDTLMGSGRSGRRETERPAKRHFRRLRTEFGQPGAERPGRRTRGRPSAPDPRARPPEATSCVSRRQPHRSADVERPARARRMRRRDGDRIGGACGGSRLGGRGAGSPAAARGAGHRPSAGQDEPPPPERREAAAAPAESPEAVDEELRARRAELARLEERLRAREQSFELQAQELEERERSLDDRRRNLEKDAGRLKEAKREQVRERAALRPERGTGQADPAARARGRDPPRQRPADPSDRGGGQTRRRPACPEHPLRGHAAGGERPRGRDHGVRGRAQVRRAEGPDHRPRGAEHPHARDPHRDRLHRRRHTWSGAPVGLRRGQTRNCSIDPGAAAPGRPHPPGADRGGLPPGALRDRAARGGGGGAGRLRGERRHPAPGAHQAAGAAEVPHQLRPERASPLGRVRAPGGDARGRARRRPARGGPRGPAARHRQGGVARGGGPARPRGRRDRAGTRRRRPWRMRWRPTTTRWSCGRSRR